jgi:3-methyladenine DNA glycosylase AlkD
MSTTPRQILKRLHDLGDEAVAAQSRRFFKTGKGQYGEGDRFLGIRVPVLRKWVREYRAISLEDTLVLLRSPFHEARQLALLILVAKYATAGSAAEQRGIYQSYLRHRQFINNWDLVDCSAEHVVGAYLYPRNRKPLYRLASARSLWDRRIAVLSTFHFVKRGDFTETCAIAEMLLADREDLIHKAAGWMLREVGKRDLEAEEAFLLTHYRRMPRTMLRYAIEKFPQEKRLAYLRGSF